MSLKLTFHIQLKSDYHISAGHGTGAGVDSALQRDADNVPVIRGTTLAGLLRDGLYQLLKSDALQEHRRCQASGLSENGTREYCGQFKNETQEPCPICRLFGAPNLPKSWQIASARPSDRNSKKYFTDSQIDQHVRINPRMRRAEPRKLYAQEVGAASQSFEFTITGPVSNDSSIDEAALLVAAARNVRFLGRSRRRGQGECCFKLINVEGIEGLESDPDWQTTFLQRFAGKWLKGTPAPFSVEGATLTSPHISAGSSEMARIRIILYAEEPLLIAHRAEAGNQFTTLPYINGQTLLGALAWQAARRYDLKDHATYQEFLRVFRRGGAQFPNLYPAELDTNLYPTIPAPRDMYTCKLAPGRFPRGHGIWFNTQTSHSKCQHDTCGSALEMVKGYIRLRAWRQDQDYEHRISKTTEMHIRMEPESGRVVEGDLFGYVVLDAGQYFVGDLICRDITDWYTFSQLTGISLNRSESFQIGKASRRGYGKARLWLERVSLSEDIWGRPPLGGMVQELQLTLLTDTIIQDTWGRFATSFEPGWLKTELGLDVEEGGIQAAAATRLVDGFNGNFQLPRWRDIAIEAGSTVHLTLKTPIELETPNQFALKGIGLRREEGFGQIAINHPIYTHYLQDNAESVGINMANKNDMYSTRDNLPSRAGNWRKTLDLANWQTCHDARFTAVARWLHANRDHRPHDLAKELLQLGAPSQQLKDDIGEYAARDKENKLKTGNQEPIEGIALIQTFLEKLNEYESAFHPTGLEMLADRLAGVVEREDT